MPIAFDCPGCRKSYTVEDALAGQKARCKHCGREFRIPGEPPIKVVPIVDVDTPPPTPAPAPVRAASPPPQAPTTPSPERRPAPPLPRLGREEPPASPLPSDSPILAIDTSSTAREAEVREGRPGPDPAARARVVYLALGGTAALIVVVGVLVTSLGGPAVGPEDDTEAASVDPPASAGEPPPPAVAPKPVAGPRLTLSSGRVRRDGVTLRFSAVCRGNPGPKVPDNVVWVIQTTKATVRIPIEIPPPGEERPLDHLAPPDGLHPDDPGPFLSYLATLADGDALVPVSNSLPLRPEASPGATPEPEETSPPAANDRKPKNPFAPPTGPRPPFRPGKPGTPF